MLQRVMEVKELECRIGSNWEMEIMIRRHKGEVINRKGKIAKDRTVA